MADGDVVTFTAIKRTEPDGLLVLTDSGVSKIRFIKMGEESQRKYGYDAVKAAAYGSQKIQAAANSYKQLAEMAAKRTDMQSSPENKSVTPEAITTPSQSPTNNIEDIPVEDFNITNAENEQITANIGVVGKKFFSKPSTKSGESIYIEVPLLQTWCGRYADHCAADPSWQAGSISSCCAMVLYKYGEKINPRQLYCMASGKIYNPNKQQYSSYDWWYDGIASSLAKKQYNWTFENNWNGSSYDFERGFKRIKTSLEKGCPVIISVTLSPSPLVEKWNAVLINGYDEKNKIVYLIDPNIAAPCVRIISYKNFDHIWRVLDSPIRRYALFSALKN